MQRITIPDVLLRLQEQTKGLLRLDDFVRVPCCMPTCTCCHSHLPLTSHPPRDLGRHIFMINTRDFMDPWTFNTRNAMKCCVDILAPDGRIIPFCTHNTLGCRE